MSVDRNVTGLVVEGQSIRFAIEELLHKLLEEMATARDFLGVGQLQFAIIFNEHRIARRFEKQNRSVAVRAVKPIKIVAAHLARCFEIALTEGGAAATFAVFD